MPGFIGIPVSDSYANANAYTYDDSDQSKKPSYDPE